MRKITLLLLVSISMVLATGCDDDVLNITLENTCVPQSKFGAAYCGDYSLGQVKFITALEKKPISQTDDAICISKEEWLLKLRPALKENIRVKKDKKKRLILDGNLHLRKLYSLE